MILRRKTWLLPFVVLISFINCDEYSSDTLNCLLAMPASLTRCTKAGTIKRPCCYMYSNDTENRKETCTPTYNNTGNFTALNASAPAGSYYICDSGSKILLSGITLLYLMTFTLLF